MCSFPAVFSEHPPKCKAVWDWIWKIHLRCRSARQCPHRASSNTGRESEGEMHAIPQQHWKRRWPEALWHFCLSLWKGVEFSLQVCWGWNRSQTWDLRQQTSPEIGHKWTVYSFNGVLRTALITAPGGERWQFRQCFSSILVFNKSNDHISFL